MRGDDSAFQLLAQCAGLQVIFTLGSAATGGAHAWNIFYNGGAACQYDAMWGPNYCWVTEGSNLHERKLPEYLRLLKLLRWRAGHPKPGRRGDSRAGHHHHHRH